MTSTEIFVEKIQNHGSLPYSELRTMGVKLPPPEVVAFL